MFDQVIYLNNIKQSYILLDNQDKIISDNSGIILPETKQTNSINGISSVNKKYIIDADICNKYINDIVSVALGISKDDFYLISKGNNKIILDSFTFNNTINSKYILKTNCLDVDIHFREKGGFIMDLISKFFEMILYPIVYPFKGILNAFLMLIKGIMYLIALLIYFVKVMVWFFADFLPSLPGDFVLVIQMFTAIIFDAFIGTAIHYIRLFVNSIGRMSIKGLMGWDNTPNENEESDSKSDYFNNKCSDMKCYRTPDGTVPFSVIIATILCPPVGVFMEYGILGWFNILIAALLTLMFYFPGLIYALILLYC
jgi:uncharacterized membrane protein YqaE (UPF0057 family)